MNQSDHMKPRQSPDNLVHAMHGVETTLRPLMVARSDPPGKGYDSSRPHSSKPLDHIFRTNLQGEDIPSKVDRTPALVRMSYDCFKSLSSIVQDPCRRLDVEEKSWFPVMDRVVSAISSTISPHMSCFHAILIDTLSPLCLLQASDICVIIW